MKNYRVYIIRKVYYPYGYETYYYIGTMNGAREWCENNRDASHDVHCNIEGYKTMTAYRINDLKCMTGNVIDNRRELK